MINTATTTEFEQAELARCTGALVCPAALHVADCLYDAWTDDLSRHLPRNRVLILGRPVFRVGWGADDDSILFAGWGRSGPGDGIALVCWLNRQGLGMQVQRADRLSHNPKLGRASEVDLARKGWPFYFPGLTR